MGKGTESSGNSRLRTAAKAGTAAGLVGLGATAAYYAYKERNRLFQHHDHEKQQQSAADMTALLDRLTDERRSLVARVAVRVHMASADTAGVLMPSELRRQLGKVGRHAVQDAVGHLRDRGFIKTVPTGGRGRRGYRSTEELAAVFQQVEQYPDIADAQNDILGQALIEGPTESYGEDYTIEY